MEQAGNTLSNPGQAIQDRLAGVQQTFESPEEALKKRMGMQPQTQTVGPVMPEQVQQERMAQPQVQQPAPVNPAEMQLPKAGPGVQVASTQPSAGVKEASNLAQAAQTQTMPSETPEWHDKLVGGDFNSLSAILANPNTPEDVKSEVQDRMYNMLNDKRMEAKANQTFQKAAAGDPKAVSDLSRELTKRSNEGSLLKAMFFQRMGLSELAKDEQNKLGAGVKYQAVVGPDNTRALIKYGADNMPMTGFDETGKLLTPDSLAKFASNALPTQSHLMPSVHGTPVQRTNNNGQVETGLMMYDPRSQQSYVQVGNTRQPTTGWTTMSQNVQAVYGAAGAKQQGTQAAQTGTQQPALPAMAGTVPAQTGTTTTGAAGTTSTGTTNTTGTTARPAAPAATTTTTPTQTGIGGGGTVVQRPGESFASFEQRRKAADEQTAANIQLKKEVAAAEQKLPAAAKGENQAKDVKNQYFANETYGLIKPLSDEIKKSTGSGLGTSVDKLAGVFGAGTTGAQAIAKLDVLGYQLASNVPRFEGSQSDADVRLYQQAAGDLSNSNKPISVRLAALQAITQVLKKYDKEGKNDWTFGEGKPAGTGTTSSGNKYKRVD